MNEQSAQAYVNLIEQLLACADDEELNNILQANQELIDPQFLQVMENYATPAFLTKKENGVSESPTQYRFEPDFSPAPPTTVCCENVTRHRHQLDLRKKELICVNPTSSRLF